MSLNKEPEITEFPYAGWIPAANGRLSFRHLGETRHPTPSIYANVVPAGVRYILAFQRRNLSDSAFSHVVDWICGVSGDFWFAVAATSTAAPHEMRAAIAGTIFVFKSKEDWRGGPAGVVRSVIDQLNEVPLSLEPDRELTSRSGFDRAVTHLRHDADIMASFHLDRSGEVYVSEPIFRDADLAHASKSFANQAGHDFDKWISDQCYFFLRDVGHQHQHHAPKVDTILTLQKRDAKDPFSWRRNILFSLHYYTISARRTRRPRVLIQALGVLAYCRSFAGICRRAGCSDAKFPEFEEEAIEASIRAQIEEQNYGSDAQERRVGRIWNARLTAIAIFAPMLALMGVFVQPRIGTPDQAKQFPVLNGISDFLSNYFGEILGVLVLFFLVTWVLAALVPNLQERSYAKDILRIGLVNRQWAALFFLLVGCGATVAGLYFGRDAVAEMAEPLIVLWRKVF